MTDQETPAESDIKILWHYDTEDADLQERQWTLKDESRTLNFTGTRLASVSSGRDKRPRWTTIDVYRTAGGAYVGYRVGISLVVHDVGCMSIAGKRLPGFESPRLSDVPLDKRIPCSECRPEVASAFKNDPASLRFEVNRYWSTIAETAEQLYEELHTTRRGEKTLSYLAATLLVNAAKHDAQMSSIVENHRLG